MIRLIRCELKKIFRLKINITILLLLLLFTGVMTYNTFTSMDDYHYERSYELTNTDGTIINQRQYWKTADRLQHSYAGTLNEKTIQDIIHDADTIMKTYAPATIDTQLMQEYYGSHYDEYFQKAIDGAYSMQEFEKIFPDYIEKNKGVFYEQIPGSKKVKIQLETFYKEDHTRRLYEKLYEASIAQTEDEVDADDDYNTTRLLTWLHADRTSDNDILLQIIPGYDADRQHIDNDVQHAYLTRYREADKTYDSTIGNTLLIQSLACINILTLFVIILLVSDIFSMDIHHKTDQIMIPTYNGYKKNTAAKLSAGLICAVGIVVLQVLLVFIISQLMLPMRNLQLLYYPQSQASLSNVLMFIYSYKEILFNAILLCLVSAASTASITMLLSYLFKNRFSTVIIMAIITLLFFVLPLMPQLIPASFIHYFLPAQMLDFQQYFTIGIAESISPYFSAAGHLIAWKDIAMLFWCIMIILISMALIAHSYKLIHKQKHYTKSLLQKKESLS